MVLSVDCGFVTGTSLVSEWPGPGRGRGQFLTRISPPSSESLRSAGAASDGAGAGRYAWVGGASQGTHERKGEG